MIISIDPKWIDNYEKEKWLEKNGYHVFVIPRNRIGKIHHKIICHPNEIKTYKQSFEKRYPYKDIVFVKTSLLPKWIDYDDCRFSEEDKREFGFFSFLRKAMKLLEVDESLVEARKKNPMREVYYLPQIHRE